MFNILELLGTVKGMVIGAALIGSVAFIGGWQVHSRFVAAKELRTLQAKLNIESELRSVAQTTNATMATNLETALKDKKIEYRFINREISNVVPQSTPSCSCALGSDFVRLWNRAARGGVPANTTIDVHD